MKDLKLKNNETENEPNDEDQDEEEKEPVQQIPQTIAIYWTLEDNQYDKWITHIDTNQCAPISTQFFPSVCLIGSKITFVIHFFLNVSENK